MANIRKVPGKTGLAYKITVTNGRDINGKQIRHYKTWTPEPKMTERQAEKEVQKVAYEFERQIQLGFDADNRQSFSNYARYVIELKERTGIKHRTIERYKELMKRIDPAIGHIKLNDLKPQHLNAFYANLGESGIRAGGDKATALPALLSKIKQSEYSRGSLAGLSGVSPTTITSATQGRSISIASAEAIATALQCEVSALFTVQHDIKPLANKTIIEYHRLISTVLTQAEKEMLVQYNAASKATPPKLERKEAETFQPEEVSKIRDCLENEPIKWKTATHLLLITGARRGEICGLAWDKVDWDNRQIKIDRAILYSSTKGIYEDSTKTTTTRYIKLPIETMELLRQYKSWYNEQRLLFADKWQETGYLFVQENGTPMNPDSLTDWLRKFAKRYKLSNVHPHKFRHTMASLLYFGGVDSIAISKRLGHAKVSTTTDIYSHIIKQADENASECIADAILRKQNSASKIG